MVKTLLCVAEKPSVAKAAANILSRNQATYGQSASKYNPNFIFDAKFLNENMTVIFTSVAGSCYKDDFPKQYQNWSSVDERDLFSAKIIQTVSDDMKDIHTNLQNQARRAHYLQLWLDNDREGEYISTEVEQICKESNPRIQVYRARFSALSYQDITRAFNNPTSINRNEAAAVKLRREVDLRTGAAFTRWLTKNYRNVLCDEKAVLSYGSCQFPTLGFVVDAYLKHEEFQPEPYWVIDAIVKKNKQQVQLKWCRKRCFCKVCCLALYASVLDNPTARVLSVDRNPVYKYKPLPLSTVEFQKRCSTYLRINSKRSMEIAEKLYQGGFISYPRTETDSFPDNFNFGEIVQTLSGFGPVSTYASALQIVPPRKGRNSDNAHPPIYPIKVCTSSNQDEKRVYEFVVRHFLACCSKDGVGEETRVLFDLGGEKFKLKGLVIKERNWLDVYPYNRWEGNEVPPFTEGEILNAASVKMNEKSTTAPPLLTESELIAKMHKEGIGTDATFQDHINKIQERKYAIETGKVFKPTPLGLALVKGYEDMGFDFTKPTLRAEMENELGRISSGEASFDESRTKFVRKYLTAFEESLERRMYLDRAFQEQKQQIAANPQLQPTSSAPAGRRSRGSRN